MVSSYMMTPLMYSAAPGAVNSISRYARRFSSVDSSLMVSKRLLMVLVLSSAAKIPLLFATNDRAVALSSAVFMFGLVSLIDGFGKDNKISLNPSRVDLEFK